MSVDKFYEMQIHKSEFTPLRFDDSFRIEVIDSLDNESHIHFRNIISSINKKLSEWQDKHTIENIKQQLEEITKYT